MFVDAAQSTPKPQRQVNENRGRFRSQPSYSSQSDEDSPRDKVSKSNRRPRTHKYQRGQVKPGSSPAEISAEALTAGSKPPLPPLSKPKINEDDDGSWEDVTTSGTESFGEDLFSTHSTPTKRTECELTVDEPSDHQFDKYLEKVSESTPNGSSERSISALNKEDVVLNQSHEIDKGNKLDECIRNLEISFDQTHDIDKGNESNECISLEASYTTSPPDGSPDGRIDSNTVKTSFNSSENHDIPAIYIEEKQAMGSEAEPKIEMLDKEEVQICFGKITAETSASASKEEILDISIGEISLEKNEHVEPTKLLIDEENSTKEKEV